MAPTTAAHTVEAADLSMGQRFKQFNKMLVFIMM